MIKKCDKNELITCTVDTLLGQAFFQNEHYEVPWFCIIWLWLKFSYFVLNIIFTALNNFYTILSLKCRKWTGKMAKRKANLISPGRQVGLVLDQYIPKHNLNGLVKRNRVEITFHRWKASNFYGCNYCKCRAVLQSDLSDL